MENNCVTLETAKKLKVAGFPQETFFRYWHLREIGSGGLFWQFSSHEPPIPEMSEDDVVAPTAQEVADQLPPTLDHHLLTITASGKWAVSYEGMVGDMLSSRHGLVAPTMAEALAALWLKLHQSPELLNANKKDSK